MACGPPKVMKTPRSGIRTLSNRHPFLVIPPAPACRRGPERSGAEGPAVSFGAHADSKSLMSPRAVWRRSARALRSSQHPVNRRDP